MLVASAFGENNMGAASCMQILSLEGHRLSRIIGAVFSLSHFI